jgi:phosphinothricin acetyltransferase
MSNLILRDANPDDAELLLAIYRPFVLETTVSFELIPPTVEEFRSRIQKAVDGGSLKP